MTWPRPPAALTAAQLSLPPVGARVTVAGLVILRQRPGTAKGVVFVTLEDETGVVNVIIWQKLFEQFRRAVIASRALRVTGRLQRDHGVTHVLAEGIEDISGMLDLLPGLDGHLNGHLNGQPDRGPDPVRGQGPSGGAGAANAPLSSRAALR